MVVVMLPVASKLSVLKLGYLCASAELDWPMDKTMQEERRSSFCKEGRNKEWKNTEKSKQMNGRMHVHVPVYK